MKTTKPLGMMGRQALKKDKRIKKRKGKEEERPGWKRKCRNFVG